MAVTEEKRFAVAILLYKKSEICGRDTAVQEVTARGARVLCRNGRAWGDDTGKENTSLFCRPLRILERECQLLWVVAIISTSVTKAHIDDETSEIQ